MSKIFEKYKLIFTITLFFLSFQANIVSMSTEKNNFNVNKNPIFYLEAEQYHDIHVSREYSHEVFIKQNKELYANWLRTEISRKMTDGKFKSWIERLLYENANVSYLFIEYVEGFIDYMRYIFTSDDFLYDFLEHGKINLSHGIISFLDFYAEYTNDENITASIIKIESKIFNEFFLKKIIIDLMSKIRPIKKMDLSNNSMFEIPTYLSEIKSLEALNMQNTHILPYYDSNGEASNFKIFENLPSLRYLNINDQDYANFETFPEKIGHLLRDQKQNIYIGHIDLYENGFYSKNQEIFVKRSIAFETEKCINSNINNIANIFRQNIISYQGTEAELWRRLIVTAKIIMQKMKNVFCNELIISNLLKTKKLNLKNILPKTTVAKIDTLIFEKIIFEEIIVKIFSKWTIINDLDLSNNTINQIPQNLYLLKNLKHCDLSKNLIDFINPKNISLPNKLTLLNLENNGVVKFSHKKSEFSPKIIGHMVRDNDKDIYRST